MQWTEMIQHRCLTCAVLSPPNFEKHAMMILLLENNTTILPSLEKKPNFPDQQRLTFLWPQAACQRVRNKTLHDFISFSSILPFLCLVDYFFTELWALFLLAITIYQVTYWAKQSISIQKSNYFIQVMLSNETFGVTFKSKGFMNARLYCHKNDLKSWLGVGCNHW